MDFLMEEKSYDYNEPTQIDIPFNFLYISGTEVITGAIICRFANEHRQPWAIWIFQPQDYIAVRLVLYCDVVVCVVSMLVWSVAVSVTE
jgi:hypothetical protein